MAQLPAPLRAALGLVAAAADAVQDGRTRPDKLPDLIPERLLELPVLAVSTALQLSLRAQQQYAALTVRGDEVLAQLRGGPPDDAPEWARFDDDPAAPPTPPPAATPTAELPPPTARPASPATKTTAAVSATPSKPAKKAAAKKAAKKAVSKAAPKTAAKTARPATKAGSTNRIAAPRTGRPSAFDQVIDDDAERPS